MQRHQAMRIGSLNDLLRREEEVLERLSKVRNGHALFVMHPFRALEDIGVHLSSATIDELMLLEPQLELLSSGGYEALRNAGEQSVRIKIASLFRRST